MKEEKRSREGCWTCRRRKKKCDGRKPSCANCERIKVQCKGYSPKILWEDDSLRESMRRRGSPKSKGRSGGTTFETGSTITIHVNDDINEGHHPQSVQELYKFLIYGPSHHSPRRSLSPHPLDLTPTQSLFLDNYINHFSLTYPTFSDSTNPFLSIIVPLALSNNTVLYAVLALSATQTGLDSQLDMRAEALSLKGRALKGCRTLLESLTSGARLNNDTESSNICEESSSTDLYHGTVEWNDSGDDLSLIASVMLLVLGDKLAGESYSTLTPHLNFARFLLSRRFTQDGSKRPPTTGTSPNRSPFTKRHHSQHLSSQYEFLYNLFRYNDLLAALASASPLPSSHTQTTNLNPSQQELNPNCKFFYPNLLSTLAACTPYHTHALNLKVIDTWDGTLNFLPSFSFVDRPSPTYPFCGAGNTGQNHYLLSEIYRNAAKIYYLSRTKTQFQQLGEAEEQIREFAKVMVGLLRELPVGSRFESALLLPLGIAAREVRGEGDREYVLGRLGELEGRFRIRLFGRFRERLVGCWGMDGEWGRGGDGLLVG